MHKIRNSHRYRYVFRPAVIERDNHTCQECYKDETEVLLEVHHIENVIDYPELIMDVDNGITLCQKCHWGIRGKEHLYIERFKEKLKNILL